MSLFSFLNPAKDFTREVAAKLYFNHNYQRYGQMTNIQIDSTAKTLHVELELKGEPAPLKIDVASYQLSTESGETFIELGEIKTSREWINLLISDFLPHGKKRFKVPGAVKAVL
ncbi:MAG: hypothetical protein B9S30_00955 [Verrucomicrobiia bacterium Tous-C5FEB]|nr:MAG: hypothetical protein B9S30_00955 [Verrucomicrobiae bacterium Tous-C5FEB]